MDNDKNMPILDKNDPNFLLSTIDAKAWADEFCKHNTSADHGMMLSWFACAIMTGFDEANRRSEPDPAKQLRNEILTIKIDGADAVKSIDGVSDLITAAQHFCDLVDIGKISSVKNYTRFKTALKKISEASDTTGDVKVVEGFLGGGKSALPNGAFYHLDGKPANFDIDEDLGQLLLACQRALDFIHNGPMLGASKEVINELYDVRVIQLIPKLNVVIDNRITVKYPYSKLVDMTFVERNDLFGGIGSFTELDKLRCTTQRLVEEAECLSKVVEAYAGGTNGLPAANIMVHMATLTEHLQFVINLFGWTWDDVKLSSRQKIGALLPKEG